MRRNQIANLMLVALLALVLAACGGSGSSSKYGGVTTNPTGVVSAPPTAPAVTLAKAQFMMFQTPT